MKTLIVLVIVGWIAYKLFGRRSGGSGRDTRRRRTQGSNGSISIEISTDSDSWSERGSPRNVDPVAEAREADRLWVGAGDSFKVGSHDVPGGMVYVGKKLSPARSWGDSEPALVNPSLKVAWQNPDRDGSEMSYWPSYSEISPASRAAYVEWLASGRSDPGANIGYVFLYFYGIERRLLLDLQHLPDRRSEADGLISEVERLLGIYGTNRSFEGYATRLLYKARALWSGTLAYQHRPTFRRGSSELPGDVRLAVGQLAAAGEPIPADWAMAWVMGHPDTRLKTPAKRCREEFEALFLKRYADKFGAGMKVKPNKRRLKLSYRPASSSFGGAIEIPIGDLPDVAALSRPLAPLREIVESIESDLAAYSRAIGRDPKVAGSLEALALLPPELAKSRPSPEAEALKAWVDSTLGGKDIAVVAGADLMARWSCERADRISKREIGSFASLLNSFDVAIEPDPRFGGGAIPASGKAILFRPGPERLSAASSGYRAATLLLHLASVVAVGDGEISESEERHLEEHLERSMHLRDPEARRLRAHLQWLLVEQPSLAGIKKRLEATDVRQRQGLAEFAVAIAGADGVIDPGEVKTITKIYKLLGFEPEQAYSDIHSLQAGGDWKPASDPVTVRPAETTDAGFKIGARPETATPAPNGDVRLDMTRVERTLAETAVVSSMLADIFVDEDRGAETAEVAAPPMSANGLDSAHARLLAELAGRSEWSREEFEALTDGLGLLTDGAYETLNEAAFEATDCPLLEGEDPIEVDHSILGELTA